MNAVVNKFSPSITSMIRADHSVVLAKFHRIKTRTSAGRKHALVNAICLALEIHAQVEEEIFYPALRQVAVSDSVLDKSVPEHNSMRAHIARLRQLSPQDGAFDQELMALMRDVIHHVADEETVLLPEAERLMPDRLGELGAQMARRKLELMAPHAGELVVSTARGLPVTTVLLWVGAAVAGGMVVRRAMRGNGEDQQRWRDAARSAGRWTDRLLKRNGQGVQWFSSASRFKPVGRWADEASRNVRDASRGLGEISRKVAARLS